MSDANIRSRSNGSATVGREIEVLKRVAESINTLHQEAQTRVIGYLNEMFQPEDLALGAARLGHAPDSNEMTMKGKKKRKRLPTGMVRASIIKHGKNRSRFSVADVCDIVGSSTGAETPTIKSNLYRMVEAKDLIRSAPGEYRLAAKLKK